MKFISAMSLRAAKEIASSNGLYSHDFIYVPLKPDFPDERMEKMRGRFADNSSDLIGDFSDLERSLLLRAVVKE